MEKTPTHLRQHRYQSMIQKENLKILLDSFGAVQLGEPTSTPCGEMHTSYFLSNITAGLSYKTKREPYSEGPLGTPGWTIMTHISLCGPDAEGIERFVQEHEKNLARNRWVEPATHPYASPYRL
ncbi:MAG: hypothetical protein AABX47_03195 [Nanoarchaeota archaeon]